MKMLKVATIALASLLLIACEKQTIEQIKKDENNEMLDEEYRKNYRNAFYEKHKITCFSGGKIVFEDVSTIMPRRTDSGVVYYQSEKTNKIINLNIDCVFEEI